MDKRGKYILALFLLVIFALMIFESSREKPVNWRESYSYYDKIPYGMYIFREEIGNITGQPVVELRDNPMIFLQDSAHFITGSNLILINSNINLDYAISDELLNFAANGNTVFLSGRYFDLLQDTLKLEIRRDYTYNMAEDDTVELSLSNPILQNTKERLLRISEIAYIDEIDSTGVSVLGQNSYYPSNYSFEYYNEIDTLVNRVIFVEKKIGKGKLLLHTEPKAFTNYGMLKGNPDYVAACLSYLQPGKIYLDSQYKDGRQFISTPLRYVLSEEPLKWAYYLLISGLIFLMIFRAKREQRIIPIIQPPKNQSVEFTKTIGNMYFQKGDFSDIIDKKISYLFEHWRSRYYVDTSFLDKQFISRLSVKASVDEETTTKLVNYIRAMRANQSNNENNLIQLNRLIEEFQSKAI